LTNITKQRINTIMTPYQLYCFGESGNAYKVALYLEMAKLPWTPRFVDFFNGETRSPEYRATVNEMGEAPVLVDGEMKLTQSAVILQHLARKHNAFKPDDEDEALRWMFFDNHKFTSYIATLRFMISITKTGETPVTEFLRGRAINSLKIVDKHLENRTFILGDKMTTADFSLCGYLFYGDELPFDLTTHKNITSWLNRIKAMPNWKHPYDLLPRKA
jgi:glutathione S-transferase